MILAKQNCSYTFSDNFDYNWRAEPLIVRDSDKDFDHCPVDWPKNCQISPTEWLFFGGAALELGYYDLPGAAFAG